MQYVLTEEEYRELNKKAMRVMIYAKELKRVHNLSSTEFSVFAKELINKHIQGVA